MRKITSRSNETIKFIKSLQMRKNRNKTGKFYFEGVRQVGESFLSNYPLDLIVYSPDLLIADYGREIIERAKAKDIELIEVTEDVFRSFSNKNGPHGLAAVGNQRYQDINESQINGLWIALESVQDPGNLGSILRSLDGAGGKGVILIGQSTDPFHPTAVRASMGAVFYLPIMITTRKEFIIKIRKDNIFCVGTSCDTSNSYRDQPYFDDMVLIMGSEQKGISLALEKTCDALVTIPMAGKVDSLNLANAASIVLFEIYAKRKNQ